MRIRELDAIEALLQAAQMLLEAERSPRIHWNQLIHAIAEQKAAIHDGDLGLVRRQPAAVEEDSWRHWKNNRMSSHNRPRKPARGTVFCATTGYSPQGWPPTASLSVPTTLPAATGATRGC